MARYESFKWPAEVAECLPRADTKELGFADLDVATVVRMDRGVLFVVLRGGATAAISVSQGNRPTWREFRAAVAYAKGLTAKEQGVW